MGGDPNEVIVIEDNGIKQNRKKSPKDTGGVLGMFGKKQSGKGRSVVHLFLMSMIHR